MKIVNCKLKIKEILLDILFPKKCIECDKEGNYVCEKCSVFISESILVCPICGNANHSGQKHFNCSKRYDLDGLINIWDYEGVMKKLILEIKYRGVTDAISGLVEDSFKTMTEDKKRFKPFLSFLLSENTCIAYVPMHRKKQRRRGFNQSEIIAKKIGKMSNCKVVSLLEKTVNTKSQTKLTKEERMKNVRDSFSMIAPSHSEPAPGHSEPAGEESRNQNVLLVDDVFTTGATMKECCKVLKQSGIKNIWGFTLARTP